MSDAMALEMPQDVVTQDSAHGEDSSISSTHRSSKNSNKTPAADESGGLVSQVLKECTGFRHPISAGWEPKDGRTSVRVEFSINRVRSIIIANNRTQVAKGDTNQECKESSDDATNGSDLGSLGCHATCLEVKSRKVTKSYDGKKIWNSVIMRFNEAKKRIHSYVAS